MISVFEQYKYGLFVHFVGDLSIRADGSHPRTMNELVQDFDVEAFADQVASMNVQYLILTAWHYKMRPLYPSAVTEKWRPGNSPSRDLLGEIIDAVTARGIGMILYTHPRDGHDFDDEDRLATGWGIGHEKDWLDTPDFSTFDYKKWNTYIKELYTELAQRYGKKLLGFYTDGVGPYKGKHPKMEQNFQIVDYLMIRDIMKSVNPNIAMIQNYFGYLFSNDYAMPEGFFGYEDVTGWDVSHWPAAEKGMALCPFTGGWWPEPIPRGKDVRKASVKNMVQYTLFYASCSNSGGLAFASGPYCEGNLWPVGVLETLQEAGRELARFDESVFHAGPSQSYPTVSGDTLGSKHYRFFTTSTDGRFEYLHLLKPPVDNCISLDVPADSILLSEPQSMTRGLEVKSFHENPGGGWNLTLTGTFDPIDSVIRFERTLTSDSVTKTIRPFWLNDTDKRIRYEGTWNYHHLTEAPDTIRALGCFEHDFHRASHQGDAFFLAFEGDVIEIYGNKRPGNGSARVFLDGIFMECITQSADDAATSHTDQVRQLLYRSGRLHGGWHTLYVVLEQDLPFELDAVRIR